MQRPNLYNPVTEEVTNNLCNKYPGLTVDDVRKIVLSSMDIMFKHAFKGRRATITSNGTISFWVERKPGHNYLAPEKRRLKAVSDIRLGTELQFVIGGSTMMSKLVNGRVNDRMKRILQKLVNNEKYINSVL